MTACPCCGAALKPDAITVSLDTNAIAVGWCDTVIALSRQEAEILWLLAQASPRVVASSEFSARLWPSRDGDFVCSNLKVRISILRPMIRPLGLQLENIVGHGYRLVRRRETAADRQLVTRLATQVKEAARA